jgi:lactate permease
MKLSQMAGRQLPFFSLLVPAWLVWVMAGWRGVVGVWPALVVTGGSFALVQYLVANLHGPWLVDVAGGLISLVCLALLLRIWQPRERWTFPDETEPVVDTTPVTKRALIVAWVPWLLLTLFVFVWGLPAFKKGMAPLTMRVPVPALHEQVAREPPVVAERQIETAVYEFNALAGTGTGIFLAALLSAVWMRVSPLRTLHVLGVTFYRLRWPLVTIVCMLAIAFTTRYGGLDASLGLAFTRTGIFYPIFAALLGWLGVALTGSDTSSNALFGSLQTVTAHRLVSDGVLPLSVEQASVLLASANSTGGVMGKMVDAQSIVVSAAATQQPGQEGPILRFVFWHSIVLAVLMGLLVLCQAYVWTGSIP